MKRKAEYFGIIPDLKGPSVVNTPVNFYRQERDWTCSIGCIRSAISCFNNKITEDEILKQEHLKMGPQWIEDIKNWKCLKGLTILTHEESPVKTINDLYNLLLDNYIVICLSCYNLLHYMVVYGYLTTNERNNPEYQYVQFYDPYLDEHKLMNADLFESMWYDKTTNTNFKYIAIKQD